MVRQLCARGGIRPAFYLGASVPRSPFISGRVRQRTTPTRVAISVTVNSVTASLVGAVLLGEPLSWNLAGGIATVFAGIWIATTTRPVQPKSQIEIARLDTQT